MDWKNEGRITLWLVILFLGVFLFLGAGKISDHQITHASPTGMMASDAFTHNWVAQNTYDTGYIDTPPNYAFDSKEEAEQKVGELIDDFHQGKLESLPGRTARETLELRILETLNKARNKGGEIAMSEGRETNAVIMARSGARGNVLNIAQMAAVVGQQALRGKRIDRGYKKRTLSYFAQNDLGPEARGFTRNSFKSGLTPVEFFFGSMTGRESLMDTALRTPKSGYLYRRLSNSLQDVKVEYDGTVRDASGRIVQFQFGEDGIDVSKTENGIINVKRIIEDMK